MKGALISRMSHSRKRSLLASAAVVALCVAAGVPAMSQTLNDQLSRRGADGQKSRLLVDAREIVYDNNSERVEARGDVQLYYQGRLLEADKVIYDRKTKRVYAEGNAKLTDTNGQIIYSDRFELTDDFRDGFIDSLRVVSTDTQRITAARGERTDGETTVFERGIYTACETCKDNPEKPPLWQVKAARIIAKNSEQMIYYEDARLEFFGLPVAYVPFFSAPDPTVRRKSGILTPRYSNRNTTGFAVSIPVYWAAAPHYDVLWTPTFYSRQGLHNEVEWRHRLETGVYNIRVSGIFQLDSDAFLSGPGGPNKAQFADPTGPNDKAWLAGFPDLAFTRTDNRNLRGSIETTGRFLINERWTFGWDVALTTDKYYLNNYRIKSEAFGNLYNKETISTVYLQGKTTNSYFDLAGLYFQGQTSVDWQKQSPVVHPVLDFNRRFRPESIGGELSFDLNFTSLTRELPDYVGLPPQGQRYASTRLNPNPWFGSPSIFRYFQNGGGGYSLYNGCATYVRGECLVRGLGGTSSRATATLGWRRNFIDPLGQVWTPFVNAQVTLAHHALDLNNAVGNTGGLANLAAFGSEKQANFISSDQTSARVTPAVGVEYRYPFVGTTGAVSHLFEPIAQLVVRPNEARIGRSPNEDSQSLVFSDANLFSLNRFSGYDRTEGGTRASVGAQYTATFASGAYVNAMVGQSYHLAGRNSFRPYGWGTTDILNTGLNSGLDKARSDYVGRFAAVISPSINLVARGRFDEETLRLKRLDVSTRFSLGPLHSTIAYSRQEAQPDLGFVRRREGMSLSSTLTLPNRWYVTGNISVDLDRYLRDRDIVLTQTGPNFQFVNFKNSPFRPSSYALGFGYADECTVFSFNYLRSTSDFVGQARKTTTTAFLFRLELKHLGEVNYRKGETPLQPDGIR